MGKVMNSSSCGMIVTNFIWASPVGPYTRLGLSLGLQALYSATNCVDNILGPFTIINQIKSQE